MGEPEDIDHVLLINEIGKRPRNLGYFFKNVDLRGRVTCTLDFMVLPSLRQPDVVSRYPNVPPRVNARRRPTNVRPSESSLIELSFSFFVIFVCINTSRPPVVIGQVGIVKVFWYCSRFLCTKLGSYVFALPHKKRQVDKCQIKYLFASGTS